jgi:hypothetical protein
LSVPVGSREEASVLRGFVQVTLIHIFLYLFFVVVKLKEKNHLKECTSY